MRFSDERVDLVLEFEKYMCICNMIKLYIEDIY